jgi:hypothetical protein
MPEQCWVSTVVLPPLYYEQSTWIIQEEEYITRKVAGTILAFQAQSIDE